MLEGNSFSDASTGACGELLLKEKLVGFDGSPFGIGTGNLTGAGGFGMIGREKIVLGRTDCIGTGGCARIEVFCGTMFPLCK